MKHMQPLKIKFLTGNTNMIRTMQHCMRVHGRGGVGKRVFLAMAYLHAAVIFI